MQDSDLSRLLWIIAGCQLLFLLLDHSLNPFPKAAIGATLAGLFQPLKLSPDRRYLCVWVKAWLPPLIERNRPPIPFKS